MHIFNFIIDDSILYHNKNSLNIGVFVQTNNLKIYKKKIEQIIRSFQEKEPKLLTSAKYLSQSKAVYKRDQSQSEFDFIVKELANLKNQAQEVFYDNLNLLNDKITQVTSFLYDNKETLAYENLYSVVEEFCSWFKLVLARKLDISEKLGKLDGQPLRAIVNFKETSFETSFTKYYLNLEHFSEMMHYMLQRELKEVLVDKYYEIERKHFELKNNPDFNKETATVKNFINLTEQILYNYSLLEEFDLIFLKAQVNYGNIKNTCESIIKENYLLAEKFNRVYSILTEYANSSKIPDRDNWIKTIFVKTISFAHEFKVEQFFSFKESDFNKMFEFLSNKEVNYTFNKMLFSNLEILEPQIAEKIKYSILVELKKNENIENCSFKENYLIRKAKKNVFENNQYYSHVLFIYEFMPNLAINVKNKYTVSAGFDKVLLDSRILKFSGEVFSPFLKQTVKYDLFIDMLTYHINSANYIMGVASTDKINNFINKKSS